jgi:phage regulatory protein, rha family
MLVEITGKKNEEVLTTTSRKIAEKFGKEHKSVLYAIEGRLCSCEGSGCTKCSDRGYQQLGLLQMGDKSHLSNMFFAKTYIDSRNRQQREYEITRDGYSLLAMGFTGEKALKWKLDYIKAFNAMESELKRLYTERKQWEIEREKGKLIRHVLTDTIKMKVAESPNKRFMYPNYTKLIYKSLFGKPLKELQKDYNVKAKESIREYLTGEQLKDVESMEMLISSLINCGWGYEQIKNFIQENNSKQLAG